MTFLVEFREREREIARALFLLNAHASSSRLSNLLYTKRRNEAPPRADILQLFEL